MTYFILSNFYNFSQLVNTHPFLFYQLLSSHQSFIILSNFCHLLAPCYLLTFYVIFSSYKFTYCTHHKHNSLLRLIVRTLSAPIQFPNSTAVFGHRAILTMGGSDRGWGFLIEQTDMLYELWRKDLPVNLCAAFTFCRRVHFALRRQMLKPSMDHLPAI